MHSINQCTSAESNVQPQHGRQPPCLCGHSGYEPESDHGSTEDEPPAGSQSVPALIIKPRFILVMHMDDHGWYITSNLQGTMFLQNLKRIVRKPNVMPRQFPYCTTDSIPIDLMFQGNFPTDTEVWNCQSHRNYCQVTSELPIGATSATHIKSETSVIRNRVFHHVHGLGQQPTDRNQRLLRSQRMQLQDGSWL